MPRSMSGTPRKEWYDSSPDSLKYLKRGCFFTSSTAIGTTCSATRPARPSWMGMRNLPMQLGCRPRVAASTRLERSGSSRYAEQTSVRKRMAMRATTFIKVSAGLPPSRVRALISSIVKT
jgi:hypothetical protein